MRSLCLLSYGRGHFNAPGANIFGYPEMALKTHRKFAQNAPANTGIFLLLGKLYPKPVARVARNGSESTAVKPDLPFLHN